MLGQLGEKGCDGGHRSCTAHGRGQDVCGPVDAGEREGSIGGHLDDDLFVGCIGAESEGQGTVVDDH